MSRLGYTRSGTAGGAGVADGVTIGGVGTTVDPFAVIAKSPAQWFVDINDFVKEMVPDVEWQMPYPSECMGLGDITLAAVAGTGGFDPLRTRSGGWWRVFTGTTPLSTRVGFQRDSGGVGAPAQGAVLVSNTRTQPWATAVRTIIVSLPGGNHANDALYICNLVEAGETGIHVRGATSQVNFAFGVGGSWINTGVAVTTNAVYDLVTINDPNGAGTVRGYARNVTAGASFAQIGSAASSSLGTGVGFLRWYAFNNGAFNHEFLLDKVCGLTALE
jgi:hypothetical protein